MFEGKYSDLIAKSASSGNSKQVEEIINNYLLEKQKLKIYSEEAIKLYRDFAYNTALYHYARSGHFHEVNNLLQEGFGSSSPFIGYENAGYLNNKEKLIEVLVNTTDRRLLQDLTKEAKARGTISEDDDSFVLWTDRIRSLVGEHSLTIAEAIIYLKINHEKCWLLQGMQLVTQRNIDLDFVNSSLPSFPPEIYHIINGFLLNCSPRESENIYVATNHRLRNSIKSYRFAGAISFFRSPPKNDENELNTTSVIGAP
ncbi:hypothetical protein [Fluoribacter gormanii]|uniref:hypothetical protein n=1 Tax=Fluoribacter gormanii TaxID=464 RepID=UPI00104174FF|nr:hypothetical protein [Fluoribacter gormanii]